VEVPLVERPFGAVGKGLGLDEGEVLDRVERLKAGGVIRQIGAIFDTKRLGYKGTLVAFHTDDHRLEEVAARISAHPGVSHNYARPHHYNLWFTLAVPPGLDVELEIARLARATGTGDWLNLPALRVFKLRTHFKLDEAEARPSTVAGDNGYQSEGVLEAGDIPYVRALQQDLPLISRPFGEIGVPFGLDEEDVLTRAREFAACGIMRRFGAVLRHRRVGYRANGMACWVVPPVRIEEVGRFAATSDQVSHCYERPAYPPRWPYSLFTMIHGRTQDAVEAVVSDIARHTGLQEYEVLYSTREFKKERVRYFEEAI
jgi:DNA-binding Lrp family transcriptional regulator